MILANGEGQFIFLVVMAVIGLINWIASKVKEGAAPPPNPTPDSARRPLADPEEERMRRFMEALGLPADSRPEPPRPAPRPRAEHLPVPPIVAPSPLAPRPRPRPAVTPPPLQPPLQPTSLDELPAPTRRAEEIKAPDLVTRSMPAFETVGARISASPNDFPSEDETFERPAGPSLGDTLRAALASPQQLRSAFVLSEVFGTPPGLRRS